MFERFQQKISCLKQEALQNQTVKGYDKVLFQEIIKNKQKELPNPEKDTLSHQEIKAVRDSLVALCGAKIYNRHVDIDGKFNTKEIFQDLLYHAQFSQKDAGKTLTRKKIAELRGKAQAFSDLSVGKDSYIVKNKQQKYQISPVIEPKIPHIQVTNNEDKNKQVFATQNNLHVEENLPSVQEAINANDRIANTTIAAVETGQKIKLQKRLVSKVTNTTISIVESNPQHILLDNEAERNRILAEEVYRKATELVSEEKKYNVRNLLYTTAGKYVWQQIGKGPVQKKYDHNIYRGYLMIDSHDIPKAVNLLMTLAEEREKKNKPTMFKWALTCNEVINSHMKYYRLVEGPAPELASVIDQKLIGNYDSLQAADPRIALYADEGKDILEILSSLSKYPEWEKIEFNRIKKMGGRLENVPLHGSDAFIDSYNREWRTLNYNTHQGHSSR